MTWAELKTQIEKMSPTEQRRQVSFYYPDTLLAWPVPINGVWKANEKDAKGRRTPKNGYCYLRSRKWR